MEVHPGRWHPGRESPGSGCGSSAEAGRERVPAHLSTRAWPVRWWRPALALGGQRHAVTAKPQSGSSPLTRIDCLRASHIPFDTPLTLAHDTSLPSFPPVHTTVQYSHARDDSSWLLAWPE